MMFGLDRFSEDLDFSLFKPNDGFTLVNYLDHVRRELAAWKVSAKVDYSDKVKSQIESAFIKANTVKSLLEMKIPGEALSSLHRDEVSTVKFEIDTLPPCTFDYEFRYILDPIPFSVCTMSPSDLFAGKMHAILARGWQKRVKGRDWYDLIWFIKNKVPLNLKHLEARLKQSRHLEPDSTMDAVSFRHMLQVRIQTIDVAQAKRDVLPFILNPSVIENWSADLFTGLIDMIIILH